VLEPRPPIQPKETLEDKMSNLNTKNDTINDDDDNDKTEVFFKGSKVSFPLKL